MLPNCLFASNKYCCVSKMTILEPLSAGLITMCLYLRRCLRAVCSCIVMLGVSKVLVEWLCMAMCLLRRMSALRWSDKTPEGGSQMDGP